LQWCLLFELPLLSFCACLQEQIQRQQLLCYPSVDPLAAPQDQSALAAAVAECLLHTATAMARGISCAVAVADWEQRASGDPYEPGTEHSAYARTLALVDEHTSVYLDT